MCYNLTISAGLHWHMLQALRYIRVIMWMVSTHHHWGPAAGSPDQRSPAWLWYWQSGSQPGQALEAGETQPPPAPSSETLQTLSLHKHKSQEEYKLKTDKWNRKTNTNITSEHDGTYWDKERQGLPKLMLQQFWMQIFLGKTKWHCCACSHPKALCTNKHLAGETHFELLVPVCSLCKMRWKEKRGTTL